MGVLWIKNNVPFPLIDLGSGCENFPQQSIGFFILAT